MAEHLASKVVVHFRDEPGESTTFQKNYDSDPSIAVIVDAGALAVREAFRVTIWPLDLIAQVDVTRSLR